MILWHLHCRFCRLPLQNKPTKQYDKQRKRWIKVERCFFSGLKFATNNWRKPDLPSPGVWERLKCKSQQRGEWKFTDNDRLGRLVNAGTLSSAYITTRCIQWWLPGNEMKQLKSISDAFLNCTYNCKYIFWGNVEWGTRYFSGDNYLKENWQRLKIKRIFFIT